MVLRMAATVVEVCFTTPAAFSLDDKLKRIAKGKQKQLTVYSLHALVNGQHKLTIRDLHWLRVLVWVILQLCDYEKRVLDLFDQAPKSMGVPADHISKLQPLKTNGCNKTIITELKAALQDFLTQQGVTKTTYKRVLALIGGDGLTDIRETTRLEEHSPGSSRRI
jgi:hypothetical protein